LLSANWIVRTGLALLLTAATATAQRLPDIAIPQHYILQLTPNLQSATFTGEETITLTLTQASDEIVLNAWQLNFDKVTVEAVGNTVPANVSVDAKLQRAIFHFAQKLPPGPATLHIAYHGTLNNELRGFYLSKTATRNYAVTQFEPTDARRAFPSFDEPAYKATFDVSLIIAKDDTAIGNTNIVSDKPGPGPAEHTITFARTPKMSTYLVAFLVGDFQCLSGESDGVPIRACATPGKVQFAHYALAGAEFFLHYYDNYFGIKYPMPKLDMIAIPDFEAGAMENFGAITYRETAMLVDEKTASLAARKNVAVDVAHEMAHQWFGDMVTTAWWNNIWLNEGFATWMSSKPIAAWKPEWQVPQIDAVDLNIALDLDAGRVTRAIRARADTPEEINEMFDGITYGKAAAVLQMTESYLGEEAFRAGVHNYLQAHLFANATAEDFWNTLTQTSGKPVDKIMESLVTQPGAPLLTFGRVRDGQVQVVQNRFLLSPQAKSEGSKTQSWFLPICFKTIAGSPDCKILSEPAQSLRVPPAPLFYGNAGGKGYYRSHYDHEDEQQLLRQLETNLTPPERITYVGGQWAQTRAGIASVDDFLHLATVVHDDTSPFVISTIAAAVRIIDQEIASTPEDRKAIAVWVRKNFAPALARLGPPTANDPLDKILLRANLFLLVGGTGADPDTITQATHIAKQYLASPETVDPTLGAAALTVAAQNGDAAFFDQVQHTAETSPDPQLRNQALRALASFRELSLITRALNYAVSTKVRNQDAVSLFEIEMGERSTRDAAWQYVQQDWPRVQAQMTTWAGASLVASTGNFCSETRQQEVTDFFRDHVVPASASALDKARVNIADCVQLRKSQQDNLRHWSRAQPQP
jgi:aminopeptidase N/puromycin-sensitive aminopeptidase